MENLSPEIINEENYLKDWYGDRYLGEGMIMCSECDQPVRFEGIGTVHSCAYCQKEMI